MSSSVCDEGLTRTESVRRVEATVASAKAGSGTVSFPRFVLQLVKYSKIASRYSDFSAVVFDRTSFKLSTNMNIYAVASTAFFERRFASAHQGLWPTGFGATVAHKLSSSKVCDGI